MPTFTRTYSIVVADETKFGAEFAFHALPREEYLSFSPGVLGLGNLSADGEYTQALAAVFDLENCSQKFGALDKKESALRRPGEVRWRWSLPESSAAPVAPLRPRHRA